MEHGLNHGPHPTHFSPISKYTTTFYKEEIYTDNLQIIDPVLSVLILILCLRPIFSTFLKAIQLSICTDFPE